MNARWRVFYASAGLVTSTFKTGDYPLLACRRTPGPAKSVITLGTSRFEATSCDCVSAGSLVGDRVLITRKSASQYHASGTLQLVDLAGARFATVRTGGEDGPEGFPEGFLSVDGGLASYAATVNGSAPTTTASVEDRAGRRDIADVFRDSIAPSAARTGFYMTHTDGSLGRIAVGSTWEPSVWVAAPALAPVPNPVRLTRPSAIDRRTVAIVDGEPIVVASKHDSPGRRWLEAFGRRITAPSRGPLPKVLSTSASGRFVLQLPARSGREAHAELRRVGNQQRFSIPVTSVPTLPGSLLITSDGALVVADGNMLRWWDPAPHAVPIGGVHDLAEALVDPAGHPSSGFYYSDAAGTVGRATVERGSPS